MLNIGDDAGRISIRDVTKRFDGPDVLKGINLDIAPGEVLALLGPSGCGKTTLLRAIAGLERINEGDIAIDGQVVSSARTHVSPEHRRIGMVFQDWALFPHLSVGDNVAFGLPRKERSGARVSEALQLVGLGGMSDRMPSTLSGGQQQRVALARALAPRPRAILLDEPFSNLDTTLRIQIRSEVHHLLSDLGITTAFVTHDQEEAFVLGNKVAVMHDGMIEQHSSPAEIYESPATRWVADFVGEANLVNALAFGHEALTPFGPVPLLNEFHGPIDVVVRPEHLHLSAGFGAEVELVEYYGHDHVTILRLDDGQRVRSRLTGPPRFQRGQSVAVSSTGIPSVAFALDEAS
jgi:iron(III) transport system ATP-binding protein